MRRAHVYQRSAPRADRHVQVPIDRAATARTIAVQLGHIIDKADQGGLSELGDPSGGGEIRPSGRQANMTPAAPPSRISRRAESGEALLRGR